MEFKTFQEIAQRWTALGEQQIHHKIYTCPEGDLRFCKRESTNARMISIWLIHVAEEKRKQGVASAFVDYLMDSYDEVWFHGVGSPILLYLLWKRGFRDQGGCMGWMRLPDDKHLKRMRPSGDDLVSFEILSKKMHWISRS